MQADLAELSRRPSRYWNVDGLPELMMGLLWMSWGGAWIIGDSLPPDAGWRAYWVLVPAALAGSGYAAVWLTKRLKARITFPRTGYVEWKEPSRGRRSTTAGIALVVAAILATVASGDGGAPRNVASILGVVLSLAFVVASMTQRAPHYLALAAVALALGIALGSTVGGWSSASWLFVAIGAASVGVGALRLARFLRRYPRPRSVET